MKISTLQGFALLLFLFVLNSCNKNNEKPVASRQTSITLFSNILFYDGYAGIVNKPVPANIIRVSNSKYTTKLTDANLDSISNSLMMSITVKAACDNYDRLGHVFISLVNKGDEYDKDDLVAKIEIARFITPFMDKNKLPNEVSYTFEVDNIAKLIKDQAFINAYDFWIEFDIFGVPYAANKEIEGCAGRNDTFYGTLKLISTNEPNSNIDQYLEPVSCIARFDNYQNTDVLGETTKTFDLDIKETLKNAKIYLITSNHGANSGGEEYNRRDHYIYLDGVLLDKYKPGGKSCEPYRKVNTQGNGIYGASPRTDPQWASWSNWCPGDKIPIRIYELGDLSKGNHVFKIEVPDAQFVDGQGNIPLSVYIQGDK